MKRQISLDIAPAFGRESVNKRLYSCKVNFSPEKEIRRRDMRQVIYPLEVISNTESIIVILVSHTH